MTGTVQLPRHGGVLANGFQAQPPTPCGEGIYPRWGAKQPSLDAAVNQTGCGRFLGPLRSPTGINPLTTTA